MWNNYVFPSEYAVKYKPIFNGVERDSTWVCLLPHERLPSTATKGEFKRMINALHSSATSRETETDRQTDRQREFKKMKILFLQLP